MSRIRHMPIRISCHEAVDHDSSDPEGALDVPLLMAVNQIRHWACRFLMKGENEAKGRVKRFTVSLNVPLYAVVHL
ncbi:hypothetical protein [Paenibacillus sp. OSY-SE]|uniref:hypothetical protein n=1 Tax=Paenibacillus sp. OSY-SE TaxID=1196323 RepID=UPI00037D5636|nr:hypothetical protein [Paenibacillus sp. OSY-SE]